MDSARELFDVPDDVAYFNTASLSPVLRAVREAGAAALDRRARPWEVGEADWFTGGERLREYMSRLGDAFGLVLGMTGSCALLLLISIASCVSVVTA